MKKTYKAIPFILALVCVTGCKKFLATSPDMRTDLNTPAKVGELLATAYTQADYATFTEAASDNAEDKGALASGVVIDPVNTDPYLWQDVDSKDGGSPTNYWNASYAAIAAANAALDAIDKAPDQTPYLAYKGEALVARAYAHFMLALFYAKMYDPAGANDSPGIPYVTKLETVVFGQYTRGTVASTYAAIEKDLLAGLPLISDLAYSVPKYHFNTVAANAFAARFYLFKKDYNNVIKYANLAVPNNDFVNYLRPWNTAYAAVSANAVQVLFTQATQPQNLLLTEAPSVWARNNSIYRYGMGITLNVAQIAKNATGTYFSSEPALSYGVPNYTMLKFKELFVKVSVNSDIGTPYTILPQFTGDELLMNRAEAYANLGQNDQALADLNTFASTRIKSYNAVTNAATYAKIATTYSTNDVKQGLILAILDFKKKEFIQEGLRWLDIIRLNLPVKHNIKADDNSNTYVTLPPDDPRRLFQLPAQVKLSGIPLNPR